MDPASQDKFNALGAWFLGPRSENFELMMAQLLRIVEEVREGRRSFWPDDKVL